MNYTMPSEDLLHEGTWLTWPHKYTYGIEYQNEIESIWVQMIQFLHVGENVHIISYNEKEQIRIENLLRNNDIDINKIDFVIAKSDDIWIRDTGPIFVFDKTNKLVIADFGFDGWGKKVAYNKDNVIPIEVSKSKKFP